MSFFKAFPFISRKNLALAGIDTLKPVEVSFKTDEGIKRRKFGFTEIKLKEINPFVSYKIDKKDSVGVFTLNSCVCDEKYQTTVDQFFDEVSKNNIKNVIVDLRENTGGDSRVAEYFIKYSKNLKSYKTCKVEERNKDGIKTFESKIYTEIEEYKSDKNLFDGKIFVLTSNKTFSSAMQFAEKFADNNLATIVGEVPGNSPTSYGDIFRCKAPNSEMRLNTTFKKFYRIDSTKDPERIVPDVKVAAEDALNVAYKLARFLNNQFY